MDIKINDKDKQSEEEECCDYIIIVIDSTGIKVTNRGQWMNKKWGKEERKRLSQNPRCSVYKEQENSIHGGNR